MNIYEKLQKARVELQESGLKKSGYNKFANFDYFELKDFLPKINEIFLKLKLFSKFDLLENEGVLTIINAENPEEKEKFVTPRITVEMKGQNGLQQIGSTHTYLKRYCYYNALEIIINDEVDATIEKNDVKIDKNSRNKTLTKEEKKERYLDYIAKKTGKYHQLINSYIAVHGVKTVDKLSFEAIDELAHQIVKKEKEGA